MKALSDLITVLSYFDVLLIDSVKQAVANNQNMIIRLNSKAQLGEKALNSDGVDIFSYAPYAPLTITLKKAEGRPTDRVTLEDEGDFHDSFYIDFQEDGFEIRASDWKTQELIYKYGESILGLTDENIELVARQFIVPEIHKMIAEL